MKVDYQFIIIGGGCAGLQLAKALLMLTHDKVSSILLIESNIHHEEKSWCFWHNENHTYSHLVKKQWNTIGFNSNEFIKSESIFPQTYQYINSKDFHDFHLEFLNTDNRFTLLHENVKDIVKNNDGNIVLCSNQSFSCEYAFYSHPSMVKKNSYTPKVWQHFLGWNIVTNENVFNTDKAVLMDFNLKASSDIRFIYVLPFTEKTALIECTVFSSEVYEASNYEKTIDQYIKENFSSNYTIASKESGKIPMHLVKTKYEVSEKIIPIGTAAGCIKSSTGYSFKRNMEYTEAIIDGIILKKDIKQKQGKRKYLFYDRLFIHIIKKNPIKLKAILTQLFKNNSISEVLAFLDEKTSLWQDAKIFAFLQKWPFLRAILKL